MNECVALFQKGREWDRVGQGVSLEEMQGESDTALVACELVPCSMVLPRVAKV
jgi:hypothetical protein